MKKIKNWISNSFRYRKVLQETYEWDYYPIMKFTKKHLEYLLINTQEFEEADEKRMIKEYYIKRCLLILEKIHTCDVDKEQEWEELFTILKRYLREWQMKKQKMDTEKMKYKLVRHRDQLTKYSEEIKWITFDDSQRVNGMIAKE